jgi:hypothetical protein
MKTNLVICTYGAKYGVMNKENYLKLNLTLLNKINTNISQITIMKPKIDIQHFEYPDYYNFENIEISNIKNKIKIIECENIGISYGQFLTAITSEKEFDYHIFVEDDYIFFKDYFEEYMINELKNTNEYLCMFYFRTKKCNSKRIIAHSTRIF